MAGAFMGACWKLWDARPLMCSKAHVSRNRAAYGSHSQTVPRPCSTGKGYNLQSWLRELRPSIGKHIAMRQGTKSYSSYDTKDDETQANNGLHQPRSILW
ncbi:hypothetical protein V6N13_032096 [Hibiscus sabdariffa]|uniref:Uncharacterized protein n=1 Tax=Hibiscus sabdariffa TaxID=183260 RepID=A0ABR2AV25_9ROSI